MSEDEERKLAKELATKLTSTRNTTVVPFPGSALRPAGFARSKPDQGPPPIKKNLVESALGTLCHQFELMTQLPLLKKMLALVCTASICAAVYFVWLGLNSQRIYTKDWSEGMAVLLGIVSWCLYSISRFICPIYQRRKNVLNRLQRVRFGD